MAPDLSDCRFGESLDRSGSNLELVTLACYGSLKFPLLFILSLYLLPSIAAYLALEQGSQAQM